MNFFPKHIAIIPDGNRRWARNRGLNPWIGHQNGAKTFEKILEKTIELKIPYTSFWGASWDNLTKRNKTEVNFLVNVFTKYFKKIAKDERTHRNEVMVRVLGRWKKILPATTQDAINQAIESTKNYNKYFLTLLIAYDGRDEMIECIQKITNENKNSQVKIDSELIKKHLWTKDLPSVDLVVRTGSKEDPHISGGFMMWDTAYSQLDFTKTLFPDFSQKEFEKIIIHYSKRERRMGA
ncbi:MAG: polyprenyl diphosphate synthase [Patescibacteria group bacterium]|nr:polyprenyl diphosphate synthase [Patescibacteria group bacterium]